MSLRFSRRLPRQQQPNRLSALLERRRAQGRPWLDLTAANPTAVGLPPGGAALPPLADPGGAAYAPDPRGLLAAREAVAADLAGRTAGHPAARRPEAGRILLAASTSEAYAWLFKLLCDPGDEVLVPHPGYPLLEHLAALEGARAVPYPLALDGAWRLDPGEVARRAGPRTRAMALITPHNPTGWLLGQRELEALSRCLPPGVALIADEVFADFVFHADPLWMSTGAGGDSPAPPLALAGQGRPCFSLGGLSKGSGLPQMKVGWIAVGGEPEAARAAFKQLEWIADTYLSVATPQQLALPSWLAAAGAFRQALRRRLWTNRETLARAVAATPGAQLLPSAGGWSAVVRLPAVRADEEDALELLERHDVLVQPGYLFDFPPGAFLVISLLPREEDVREGAGRLAEFLAAREGGSTRTPPSR